MPRYIATRNLSRHGPTAREGQIVELEETIAAPLIVLGLLKAIAVPPEVKAPKKRADKKTKTQDEEIQDA